MPNLIGTVGVFGIEAPEDGILIEELNFDFKPEFKERKDHMGRYMGRRTYTETSAVSMKGGIPEGQNVKVTRLAATLVLANKIPDAWMETGGTPTNCVDSIKIGYKNEDLASLDLSGVVYKFPASSPSV